MECIAGSTVPSWVGDSTRGGNFLFDFAWRGIGKGGESDFHKSEIDRLTYLATFLFY